MSEYAGNDPRVTAAGEAADPDTDERDATEVAEDPEAAPGAEDTFQ